MDFYVVIFYLGLGIDVIGFVFYIFFLEFYLFFWVNWEIGLIVYFFDIDKVFFG